MNDSNLLKLKSYSTSCDEVGSIVSEMVNIQKTILNINCQCDTVKKRKRQVEEKVIKLKAETGIMLPKLDYEVIISFEPKLVEIERAIKQENVELESDNDKDEEQMVKALVAITPPSILSNATSSSKITITRKKFKKLN